MQYIALNGPAEGAKFNLGDDVFTDDQVVYYNQVMRVKCLYQRRCGWLILVKSLPYA